MTLVDDWIGKYISFLKEQCIDGNTIIIFTLDHGEMIHTSAVSSTMQSMEELNHDANKRLTITIKQIR